MDVLALGSNKAYYYARIASSDANGRTHVLTLPFGAPHTLIVRSQTLTLADAKGAPVPASGHTEPVQTAVGATTQPYTFTVTGWTN